MQAFDDLKPPQNNGIVIHVPLSVCNAWTWKTFSTRNTCMKKNLLNEFFGKSWLFCKNVKRERVFSTQIADMYITMYIIIFVLFFLFSHLFVYETHCTVITEKTGELIKHKIVLLPLHRVKQSFF